jgi:hypothetical protein
MMKMILCKARALPVRRVFVKMLETAIAWAIIVALIGAGRS